MPRRINGSKASSIKIGNLSIFNRIGDVRWQGRDSALAYSRYSETALGADGWEGGS